MKITVDLNVLLDVAQNRLPHDHASEEVLPRARSAEYVAVLPGHAITTLHYIIEKWSGAALANQTIDALVASVAEVTGCDYIVTRNTADFSGSPVPAITPTEFLEEIAGVEM